MPRGTVFDIVKKKSEEEGNIKCNEDLDLHVENNRFLTNPSIV